MLERTGFVPRLLTHPVVAVGLATVIVVTLASLATPLRMNMPLKGMAVGQTEAVMLRQPKLEVSRNASLAITRQSTRATIAAPQIARTGKVSLFVANVDEAARELSRLASLEHGDVFSLDVSTASDTSAPSGNMEIRIPARYFGSAIEAVGRVGKVRERSVSADDQSGDIVDTSARLRNLRQTEADIRRIMDRSGNVSQVMDAENQLSDVRGQIETQESDLAYMRTQVAYATIDIDLAAETGLTPVQPTVTAQLATAWRAATAAFTQTAASIIALLLWLLVFTPYLFVGSVAAWLIIRRVRVRA